MRIAFQGRTIVDTTRSIRVLETSHPPAWYVPRHAVDPLALRPGSGSSWCEFKGAAVYFDLVDGDRRVAHAAWSYPQPAAGYEAISGHLCFYPGRVDGCWIDDEPVVPQAGGFYGGWITPDVVGPFKGEPGTSGW